MKDQMQIISAIRTSSQDLVAHLEELPECAASFEIRQAWFECLCDLLGTHQMALGEIQQLTHKYASVGMGYMLINDTFL